MIDTYRDKQIDRFINNEMPPEERAVFIRELETDGELQQQVKLRGLLAEAEIREAEKEALRTLTGNSRRKRLRRLCSSHCVGRTVFRRQQSPLCPGRHFPDLLRGTGHRTIKRWKRNRRHTPHRIRLSEAGTRTRCHCLADASNTRFGVWRRSRMVIALCISVRQQPGKSQSNSGSHQPERRAVCNGSCCHSETTK